MPGASELELTTWKPENFGPECRGIPCQDPVNPSFVNLAFVAKWSLQTNQECPEQFHLVLVPGWEYPGDCPCQARHPFHRRWRKVKHKVINGRHGQPVSLH